MATANSLEVFELLILSGARFSDIERSDDAAQRLIVGALGLGKVSLARKMAGELNQLDKPWAIAAFASGSELRSALGPNPITPDRAAELLYYAAMAGNSSVLTFLLEGGADPNGTQFGVPIHSAAMSGSVEAVAKLVLSGARVDQELDSKTALDFAVMNERLAVTVYLLQHGAKPHPWYTAMASKRMLTVVNSTLPRIQKGGE